MAISFLRVGRASWAAPVLILAALSLGAAGVAHACSQCMCGTPFPSSVIGGVVPSEVRYGIEERYLSKANALDEGPGSEEEREHRLAAFALWRPKARLALLGRLPYNFKEITSRPLDESANVERSHGLGDAELLVLAGVVNTGGRAPLSVGLMLGGVAPTGSNVERDATGERLDAHLQPGSGAWSGSAGGQAAIAAPSGTWDASLIGRVNGTNPHGYHYGNAVLYNAGYCSPLWRGFQAIAELNGRTAERDRTEDGSLDENTGGSVTYAAPGLRWETGLGITMEAAVQIPVVQSLYGEQTEHTTGRLTLSVAR